MQHIPSIARTNLSSDRALLQMSRRKQFDLTANPLDSTSTLSFAAELRDCETFNRNFQTPLEYTT